MTNTQKQLLTYIMLKYGKEFTWSNLRVARYDLYLLATDKISKNLLLTCSIYSYIKHIQGIDKYIIKEEAIKIL